MQTDPPWQTLDLEQASKLPEPGIGRAVYFLWRDDVEANETELLYIGASTQVSERVVRQAQFRDFGHLSTSVAALSRPRIPFNRATALHVTTTVQDMAAIERALIRRFWPPWNDGNLDGDQVWTAHIAQERHDIQSR